MRLELVAVEANDLVAPRLLGDVQRIVGGPHQRFLVLHFGVWPPSDPAAHRAGEISTIV
jgi:hypothetical protein